MSDCYALNVESESVVWCYYYRDFPLVRLRDHKVDAYWRHMPVAGSDAFAIHVGHALFRGGYGEEDRYSLLAIAHQQEPQLLRQLTLSTLDGVDLVADRAVGRGSAIWLLQGVVGVSARHGTGLGRLMPRELFNSILLPKSIRKAVLAATGAFTVPC